MSLVEAPAEAQEEAVKRAKERARLQEEKSEARTPEVGSTTRGSVHRCDGIYICSAHLLILSF